MGKAVCLENLDLTRPRALILETQNPEDSMQAKDLELRERERLTNFLGSRERERARERERSVHC